MLSKGRVAEMDRGVYLGKVREHIEIFQFHIGVARTNVEDIWQEG